MTPKRWQQIERLLNSALQTAPEERAALLDRECAGDADLRSEVESRLSSAQMADSSLKAKPHSEGSSLLDDPTIPAVPGRHFDHYSIESKLGAGGMGEVYLAHDLKLGRKVALKLLEPSLSDDSRWRSRFLREARLASSLDHPNICTVHEVGNANGRLFIAMQYLEGHTLRDLIGTGPLPLDDLLDISLQIGAALAAAHARGIVHRDIKSGNIMISAQRHVKILDFGLAKLVEDGDQETNANLTMTGQVMGTPNAMSPEQARGERADERSDIFSFGTVLYQMATGNVPFEGKTSIEIISALIKDPHKPAKELNKAIPSSLSAVIDRTLCKKREDRYQTMSEVIADLQAVVSETGEPSTSGRTRLFNRSTDPQQLRETWWHRPKHRTAVLGIAAIVLASIALALYVLWPKGPVDTAPIRSIAVLPFKPLVPSSRDEALELGMADTLITRLSNLSEINVRPISAVRNYVKLDQDALAAGREQRVDAVLDGQIQRAGEKIRVTVRLVRVGDGRSLWSDQFDEEMTDIFSVQDSISERVVNALTLKLSGTEQASLKKRQTEDAEAYQLYLQGRYHLNRLTDDGFRKGRDYFEQAINKDPSYALAYAGMADAYNRLSGWNAIPPDEGFPKAREASLKALEIDESLSEAHAQLANAQLLYDWDWVNAEKEYKRAIELQRNNADAHQLYSFYLMIRGRFDEAHTEMKRALELDPLSLEKTIGTGDIFYYERRYDDAIAQYGKALEMDPNSGVGHWALGNAYSHKGMIEQAIREYQKSIPLSGDSPDEPASLAYAYAIAGRPDEAQAILDELQTRVKRQYISPALLAVIYGALGKKDKAFGLLDQAYDNRDFLLVFLKIDPLFDLLRSDPRFSKLEKRLGLIH